MEENSDAMIDAATDILNNSESDFSYKQLSIEYLIQQCGPEYVIDKYITSTDSQIIDILAAEYSKKHINCSNINKLINRLAEENQSSDNEMEYIVPLIRMNSAYAVNKILQMMKRDMTAPHMNDYYYSDMTEALSEVSDVSLHETVSEMIVIAHDSDFHDHQWHSMKMVLADAIQNLSEIEYDLVKTDLLQIKQQHSYNRELKAFCNYYLKLFEENYCAKEDKPVSLRKCRELIRSITQS